MAWLYLLIAGVFEIGWPLGFKLSQASPKPWLWIALAACSMALSGFFLWMAQKGIPIGTAYAVWTGVGAVGTFVLGLIAFGDSILFGRCLGAFFIISGVIIMKLYS